MQILIDSFEKHLPDASAMDAWVFGSRARGDFKPFSDIDILISFSKNLPSMLVALIQGTLEESDLPFDVDLVLEEQLLEEYKTSVLRERKKFFHIENLP